MLSWRSQASGIIISTACGRLRPPRCSSSSTSSKRAVSEAPGVQIGKSLSAAPGPKTSVPSNASRARIQFSLPVTVLISPLCAIRRNGCASGQDGKVLVENLECTMPSALHIRSSARSG